MTNSIVPLLDSSGSLHSLRSRATRTVDGSELYEGCTREFDYHLLLEAKCAELDGRHSWYICTLCAMSSETTEGTCHGTTRTLVQEC